MAVTDDQVALVRAYLNGDQAEFDRLQRQLVKSNVEAFFELVCAAFVRTIRTRLKHDDSRAAVIRFVGDIRAGSPERAERIDPRMAERLIGHALEHEQLDVPEEETLWPQLRLLRAMVVEGQIGTEDVDDLLVSARRLADFRMRLQAQGGRQGPLTDRALWADLTQDEDAYHELEESFGSADVVEYATLVHAALELLARRTCPNGGTRTEIVELVGDVRARSKWWADSVPPLPAEQIVRRLLHNDGLDNFDPVKSCQAARLLLRALVLHQWLDDAEVDELLASARERADRWMGRGDS